MAAVGMLFKNLLDDWKRARATDSYVNDLTPLDKLRFNAIFYAIGACLLLIVVFFGYFLFCKITISPPFN